MNGTFDALAEFAEDPKTQDLMDLLNDVCEGYLHGQVLAALVQNIVGSHVEMNTSQTGLCIKCSNVSLTELLQTIRIVHDNAISEIPVSGLKRDQCGDEDVS